MEGGSGGGELDSEKRTNEEKHDCEELRSDRSEANVEEVGKDESEGDGLSDQEDSSSTETSDDMEPSSNEVEASEEKHEDERRRHGNEGEAIEGTHTDQQLLGDEGLGTPKERNEPVRFAPIHRLASQVFYQEKAALDGDSGEPKRKRSKQRMELPIAKRPAGSSSSMA